MKRSINVSYMLTYMTYFCVKIYMYPKDTKGDIIHGRDHRIHKSKLF